MAKEKEEDDDKKGSQEEELVVVTDDPKNLDVEPGGEGEDEQPPKKKEEDTDEETDDKEEDEEARLGASEETEEEEDQKKRQPHKSRRQRRREAENRLRNELRFLETRNDQLERARQEDAKRIDALEKGSIDGRISHAKAIIKKAEAVIAEATTNAKGEEAVEATRIRDEWRDELKSLEGQKAEADERDEEPDTPRVDPRAVAKVQAWHKEHTWYDFNKGDLDSKIVGAIDDQIRAEGYDPTSDEYFEELNERIAKVLPHRVSKKKKNGKAEADDEDELLGEDEDEDQEDSKPRKKVAAKKGDEKGNGQRPALGGPKFRTGGPGRDLKSNEVYLSKERIEALKEAGVWDDPVLRAKYLKRYREYDREHGIQ